MKKALLFALLSANVSVAAAAEYFVVVPFSKKRKQPFRCKFRWPATHYLTR